MQVGHKVTELSADGALFIDFQDEDRDPLPCSALKDQEAHLAALRAAQPGQWIVDRRTGYALNPVPSLPDDIIKLAPTDDRNKIQPVTGFGGGFSRPQFVDEYCVFEETVRTWLVAQVSVERVHFDPAEFTTPSHGDQAIAR